MSVCRDFKDLLGKNGTLCTSVKVNYICIFVFANRDLWIGRLGRELI